MTEYRVSEFESVVKLGVAPRGWNVCRLLIKVGDFFILDFCVSHWAIRDADHILKNRHCQPSFALLALLYRNSSSCSTVIFMRAPVHARSVCLLDDSLSTQMSTRKASLSNHLKIPFMWMISKYYASSQNMATTAGWHTYLATHC